MSNRILKQDEVQIILEEFQAEIEKDDWSFLKDKDKWKVVMEKLQTSDYYIADYMNAFSGFLIKNGINIFKVKEIPNEYLRGNTYVFEADVPQGCSSVGDKAFAYAINLKKLVLPASVKHIGMGMCLGCIQLAEVKLPNACDDFNTNYAFFGCISLQHINLPSTLTTIGRYCFAGSGLIDIDIPASVTTIKGNAFEGCTNLQTIQINADKIPEGWDKNWLGNCQAQIIFKS